MNLKLDQMSVGSAVFKILYRFIWFRSMEISSKYFEISLRLQFHFNECSISLFRAKPRKQRSELWSQFATFSFWNDAGLSQSSSALKNIYGEFGWKHDISLPGIMTCFCTGWCWPRFLSTMSVRRAIYQYQVFWMVSELDAFHATSSRSSLTYRFTSRGNAPKLKFAINFHHDHQGLIGRWKLFENSVRAGLCGCASFDVSKQIFTLTFVGQNQY